MMKNTEKLRAAGIISGIALFVAAALFATVGSHKPVIPAAATATAAVPLDPAVIAPAIQLEKAYEAVAAHIRPAVVSVFSEKMVTVPAFPFPFGNDFFGQFFGQQGSPQLARRVPQRGLGSGMILDQAGHILTNYHVVANVDRIKVRLADKRSFPAKIVGTDPKADIAIIQLEGTVPPDLPTVQLGDSDAMRVGQLVIAVGAPFGLTQTVTHGIISATGRSDVGISTYEDFLQTDAPINPGNSGGPLVNMHGEVIGMNSAIATGGNGAEQSAGIGFSIPSNMIKAELPTLIKGGHIARGVLGVVVQDLDANLARSFHVSGTAGALVAQVNPNSPAAHAGIRSGDVITQFDGKDVADSSTLRNIVATTPPGRTVPVKVVRNGETRMLRVTVGRMEAGAAGTAAARPTQAVKLAKLGLQVQTLTPELASRNHLDGEHGVLITGVQAGSVASMANLQPGDLIVQANHEAVTDVASLDRAIGSGSRSLTLLVKRGGMSFFVSIDD